jgi:hypothetical protein
LLCIPRIFTMANDRWWWIPASGWSSY